MPVCSWPTLTCAFFADRYHGSHSQLTGLLDGVYDLAELYGKTSLAPAMEFTSVFSLPPCLILLRLVVVPCPGTNATTQSLPDISVSDAEWGALPWSWKASTEEEFDANAMNFHSLDFQVRAW